MFDGRFRTGVDKRTGPVAVIVRRTGLTADHLTAIGLLLAVATAVAIASGHLLWGAVLLGFAAVPDLLDGPVAKASGTHSVRGAFFDSTADRVTDALVLGGIAWHLTSSRGGQWGMLPFAVLGTSTLISYQRAKAEGLGFVAKGGLMERAERIIALGVGLVIPFLLVPILWVMLALTGITAVHRFAKVWRQATAAREVELTERGVAVPEPLLFKARDDRSREPFEVRWQAWREANAAEREARRRARVATGQPTVARWRERSTDAAGRRRHRTRP